MAFDAREWLPGVQHIQDEMGVCMTLLTGEEKALLVDTGYGLTDVNAFARTLTSLPLTVLLTHGHHDHALGARWFREVSLFPEDHGVYRFYTGEEKRRQVLSAAREKGILVQESEYLSAVMPAPAALREEDDSLGGLTARVIRCPGHTPGSAVVYVPERELLLTGDDWNPCTWLFFPEALDAVQYRRNLRKLLDLPFRHVLCAHQQALFSREKLEAFLEGLTDEALRNAKAVPTGDRVGVRSAEAALPDGQVFVFDIDKFQRERKGTRP